MGRRQKGKHMKRRKSWHRRSDDRRHVRATRRLDRAIQQALYRRDRSTDR